MDNEKGKANVEQEPHELDGPFLAIPYGVGINPLAELHTQLQRQQRKDGGHSIGINPLAPVQATQFSRAPSIRTVRPNGDYSATWDSFSNPYIHFVAKENANWTFLRIGPPQLTLAVTIGGAHLINLVFRRFTTFNWHTVAHAPEGIPNGMKTTVRLLNKINGELQPYTFIWKIECLPCYDHQDSRPFTFPSFPEFYLDVERVEITYEKFYCQHCRTYPCQPQDVP
jgi:hypothetical protein